MHHSFSIGNPKSAPRHAYAAFTLIELLIVIGILSVLLTITIIAINPAKQFQIARTNAKLAGATQIAKALQQCWVDNKANWANAKDVCYRTSYDPNNVTTILSTDLASTTVTNANGTGGEALIADNTNANLISWYQINLCPLVWNGYLAAMPTDPDNNYNAIGGSSSDCNINDANRLTTTINKQQYGGYSLKIVNNRITVIIRLQNNAPYYTGPWSVTY